MDQNCIEMKFTLKTKTCIPVSSETNDGKVTHVTVTATADQELRMLDPFNDADYESDLNIKRDDYEIHCQMMKGQILHLQLKD